ncbi:hypothetical protein BH20ACT2_BH20ACT2_03840 [soil metagenome]
MSLDSANRSFYRLLGLAAAPFLLVGVLGCGVLSVTAYRVVTEGPSAIGDGPAGLVAAAFLSLSAIGAALAVRSLVIQYRATTRLTARLRQRQVPTTPQLRDLAEQAGIDHIELVDDDHAYSLTFGFTTPRTAISTALVDRTNDQELASVLIHEGYHVANRDPLKIALARAVNAGFFPLPATRHLLDRYLTGRELNADHRALRHCGRPALAGALFRASGGPAALTLGAAAAFGGDDLLDIRIAQLETQTEPAMPPIPAPTLAATAVGLGTVFAGLVATAVAVDTPTLLDTTATGGVTNAIGGLACAAMWFIGIHAIRNHRRQPPAA